MCSFKRTNSMIMRLRCRFTHAKVKIRFSFSLLILNNMRDPICVVFEIGYRVFKNQIFLIFLFCCAYRTEFLTISTPIFVILVESFKHLTQFSIKHKVNHLASSVRDCSCPYTCRDFSRDQMPPMIILSLLLCLFCY